MVHTVHVSPLRYPLGLTFSSSQPRVFGQYHRQEEVTVGGEFTYNEPLEKCVVFETYGAIEIKHVFLRFTSKDKRDLYPVYSRVLSDEDDEKNYAHVVLYRKSIQALLSRLQNRNVVLHSTNDIILRQITDSIEQAELWKATSILQDFKEQEYDNTLVNDSAVLLPSTRSAIIDSDIASKGSVMLTYLSNALSMENCAERARRWTDYLISYIYDLSFTPSDIFAYSYSHPLWAELAHIFNPDMGEKYENVKYDPVTAVNRKEVVLDAKHLRSVLCGGRPKSFCFPLRVERDMKHVVFPTEFSSNFLLWTTTLHQLPFRELAFTYILPNREKPYSFEDIKGSVLKKFPLRQIMLSLVDISLLWKESIDKVDVLMTASDEIWMTLHEGDTTTTIFVDMVIPILLSQKFYS